MEVKNPLLQQAIQAMEAKVPPDLRNTYDRIVLAGEKVMYSPQTQDMMIKQLRGNPNPAEAAGEGVAKLFAILLKESKGTLNMKAAIPAVVTLLCEGLDFMEEGMGLQVTPELLAAATKEMGSSLMQVMGMTPDKLNQMMSKRSGVQPPPQPPAGLINAPGA